jgi:putative component of membrane protein insertase Oxa1/YidC/SpoIIIJ protein YidD
LNILTSLAGLISKVAGDIYCGMGWKVHLKMNRRIVLLAILVTLGFLFSALKEDGVCGDPFEMIEKSDSVKGDVKKGESQSNVGVWLASFFSKNISAVDGDRCPSAPTCSSYSVQAFKKHGLVMGWLMTVDRLIHEGNEWSVSPVEKRGGKLKIIDPVENNDYWWYDEKSEPANR